MSENIGREEYVRLIATGYLSLGLPVPEEFWDEWDVILEAHLAEEEQRNKDILEGVPDVGPLEVWAICDEGEILLEATGPASRGEVVMQAKNVQVAGMVNHVELCKSRSALRELLGHYGKGEMVVAMSLHSSNIWLVKGDTLTVSLKAEDVAAVLKALDS